MFYLAPRVPQTGPGIGTADTLQFNVAAPFSAQGYGHFTIEVELGF
jgi:hypothetical protein